MLHIDFLKNNKNSILVWVFFLVCNISSFAQLSRKHYLPPFHSKDIDFVQSQFIYLSTFETAPFTVTVTDGAGNPIEGSPFVISKGNHARVQVGSGLSDSKLFVTQEELNNPISSKGLLLEAKKMFYTSFRTEFTFANDGLTYHAGYLTCKGESALGNSFRLGSIPQSEFTLSHSNTNFFASIMATEDNTTVSISDYNTDVEFLDVNGNILSDNLNITLNKGESYVVSGYTADIPGNLEGIIGALVTSDKPIAVNTGNFNGSFAIRGSDFAVDQIVPITDIGTEYIAIRGNGSDVLEQLILVAANDNTDVFLNGSTVPFNAAPLNAGDYLIIGDQYQGNSNQNIYITTSEPAYLYQSLGGSSSDNTTGFNFIPPITCFFLKQIDEIPDVKRIGETDFEGNVAVVTTIGAEVTVNGVPTTAIPEQVQGNTEWETYRINNLSGDITVASTGPLSVAYYGTSNAASFAGYYSSFGLSPSGNSEVYLCTDDSIDLLDYVDGFPDPGGVWSPELSSGTSVFDPLVDNFGVYNYVLNTTCTTIDITITVGMRATPILEPGLVFSSCDVDGDGFSDFDLESYVETILDGQTDISVTFHETELEADGLQNQLNSPYASDNTTIYVRLQDDLSDCITIGTLELAIGNSQSEDINYELCDSGDGTANFDLESQIENISGAVSGIPVSFYLTEANAEGAISPIDTSVLYNSSGETLFSRVESSNTCFSIGRLVLSIGDGPTIVEDLVYELCDDNTDLDATNGLVDFDLESQVDAILDGQTDVAVTFYELEADAENGLNPLLSPYTSSSKILYTRLEQETNCFAIGKLELVVNPTPLVVPDLVYALCDDDNDGLADFDLDTQIENVLNGQTGVTVTFHETINDADNSINSLLGTYNSGNTTLYTRLENDLTGCYSVVELTLSIDGGVEIITDLIYELCDVNGDGSVDFDLTSQIDIISNGVTDVTVSFYLTEINAENSINALDAANLYSSSGEVLFTRVENTALCFSTGTLELSISERPRVIENLVYELCDDDLDGLVDFDLASQEDVILDGQTEVTVTFYELEADAENGLNPLLSPYNSGSKTLYTRLEQQTNCYVIGKLELLVNPVPLAVPDLVYSLCDDDNDGLADFDLDTQIENVLNGQTGITVTFHETENDADNSINSLLGTYNSGNTTLYARLENDLTGCYSVVELTLSIDGGVEIITNLIYELCDVNGDGSVDFDLTSQIDIISNGITDVTVSFYLTEINAENSINALNSANLYSSSGEVLFTRVENTALCFSTGTLELSISEGPRVVDKLVYELCDDDLDGLVDFDLESQVDAILDGQTDVIVTFYELEADAENELNPLVSPYNSGNKTLYTRLEQDTDCYSIAELELKVNPVPLVVPDLIYSLCDDDNDGLADFDLDTQIENVLNGQTDITVTFHETENDADNSINSLLGTYNSGNTTLYTRLENDLTGCFIVNELTLNIVEGIEIIKDFTYDVCDIDGDGFADFDLASQIDELSNGIETITVSFYSTLVNATNDLNAIDTSVPFNSSGKILYIRLENSNLCYRTDVILLSVDDGPTIVEDLVYELCDDDLDNDATNGLVDFDLESQVDAILDGQTGVAVTFYESEQDANSGINLLTSPYYSKNKIIYTRLERESNCFNIGELELQVNPVPEVISGLNYSLCDDDNDGFADFDLDSQTTIILNGQANVEVTFYESQTDAENSLNVLPYLFTSNNKTIYTRLENKNTNCISFGSIELLIENVPEVNLSEIYYICEDDEANPLRINAEPSTSGTYSYTWNPKNPETDIDGEESSAYNITEGGKYSVTISNQNSIQSCETIKNIEVIELTRPFIIDVLGASELFSIQSSSTIEVVTSNDGFYEYSLDNGLWQTGAIFDNVGGGKHEVFVRDINGCNFESSKKFELLLFKPFFTPNGDNINDYWKIDGLSNEYEAFIYIYDRFGKLLKQINPTGIGWDGISNGKNMPSDDYWVLIEYTKDGVRKDFQSHFSLIR